MTKEKNNAAIPTISWWQPKWTVQKAESYRGVVYSHCRPRSKAAPAAPVSNPPILPLNGICLNPKSKLLMIIMLCMHCIHKDKSFLIKAGRHLRTEKKQKENTSKIPLTLHSSRTRARETFSLPYSNPICHKESMNSSEFASCLIQDLLCVSTSFFRQTTPKYSFPNQSPWIDSDPHCD